MRVLATRRILAAVPPRDAYVFGCCLGLALSDYRSLTRSRCALAHEGPSRRSEVAGRLRKSLRLAALVIEVALRGHRVRCYVLAPEHHSQFRRPPPLSEPAAPAP